MTVGASSGTNLLDGFVLYQYSIYITVLIMFEIHLHLISGDPLQKATLTRFCQDRVLHG